MLGIRWDHKLRLWVVFDKHTDKIIKKCNSEEEAKRALVPLRYQSDEAPTYRRPRH